MFVVLRQQQKMGYELGVGYKPISNYPGIAMYVVSGTHCVVDIYNAMLEVIKNTQNMLTKNKSTKTKISLHKVVIELIKQVSPRDTDISQTASRAWLHFDDENPILGFEDLIEALKLLEVNEILATLDNLATTTLGQVLLTSSNLKTIEFDKFRVTEKLAL